jgi:hypothetical protein
MENASNGVLTEINVSVELSVGVTSHPYVLEIEGLCDLCRQLETFALANDWMFFSQFCNKCKEARCTVFD